MATATQSKPREVKYFEMSGTAAGTNVRLSKPSVKAIENARDVLTALSKAGGVFPFSTALALHLDKFLEDPSRYQPEN